MVEAAPEFGVGVAKTESAGGRWPSARDGTGLSIGNPNRAEKAPRE